MECESCGSKIENGESYFVNIEGARLNVCFKCKRLGKIIRAPIQSSQPRLGASPSGSSYSSYSQSRSSSRGEPELVENFGERIRNARDSMNLPLNVLCEKISEKESFIDRIEKQKTRPPVSVARKLEKELGITLLEEDESSPVQESTNYKKSAAPRALTLGDILEIEKKKKKK